MGSSYIKYKSNGIWVDDFELSISMEYLLIELKLLVGGNNWLVDYIKHLKNVAFGFYPGFASLRLDEFIDDSKKEDVLRKAIERTIRNLSLKSEIISNKELVEFITESHLWIKDSDEFALNRDDIINILMEINVLLAG